MRVILTAAAAALLAGCGGGGEQPADNGSEQVPAALNPGEYEIATLVEDIRSTDGTTPATKAKASAAGDQPITHRACIASDGTVEPVMFAEAGDECRIDNVYARSGRLTMQLACSRPGAPIAHRAPGASLGLQAQQLTTGAPVYLNLLVMCAANFSGGNYPEALKFLSSAIAFFQAHQVLDQHSAPSPEAGLGRLVLSIENLSSSEMHSLWGIHSGRYLPSVLYRVRMIGLDGEQVTGRDRSVRTVDSGTVPRSLS
jgi:hypothetical protein